MSLVTPSNRPKVLLFDIGGVCVISPFKAILEYERRHSIHTGYINYAISRTAPTGAWHKLERGEFIADAAFFTDFKADLERQDLWDAYQHRLRDRSHDLLAGGPGTIKPVPDIDAESLFWTMMTEAREPDPWMYPALKRLKADGRYRLCALSNTSIFPESSPLANHAHRDFFKEIFDPYISSAHVGMRKPEERIYTYTMEALREKFGQDLQPADVLFTDDIGQNLSMGRKMGWRTLRVYLGRTKDAVKELETFTGVPLIDIDQRPSIAANSNL